MLNGQHVMGTSGLLGAGFLFEAVGFACPGWLIFNFGEFEFGEFEFKEISFSYGLWYVVACGSALDKKDADKMYECFTRSYVGLLDKAAKSLPEGSDLGSSPYQAWGVMATVSLVSALVAIGLTRKLYVHYKSSLSGDVPYYKRSETVPALLASCLSGTLMLITVGMWGNANSTARSFFNAYTTTSTISMGVPYGLMFAGLGGCLVLLASLPLFLLICRNNGQQPSGVYAAPLGPFGGAQVQVTDEYPTTQPIGVYPPATYPKNMNKSRTAGTTSLPDF